MAYRVSRRNFVCNATAFAAAAGCHPFGVSSLANAQELPTATLKLSSGSSGPVVPLDFLGLSYEVMQLEDPTFFSAKNIGLVQQFRNLAPRGVLRLGGNTSEFSWWKAKPDQAAPQRVSNGNDPGEPPPDRKSVV